MTANKVATSGSIKNTILMFSVPFHTRELGDMAVIRLRIIHSDSPNIIILWKLPSQRGEFPNFLFYFLFYPIRSLVPIPPKDPTKC